MTDASMPTDMRWIPKGMTVAYLKPAEGRMHARAIPEIPIISSLRAYELPVRVTVHDSANIQVFQAEIAMWLSPKKPPSNA
jgi:hypothetical protein